MNKKAIIVIVIMIIVVIGYYMQFRGNQLLKGDIDGLNVKIQTITNEKNELIEEHKKQKMKYDEELGEMIDELEANQKISSESIDRAEKLEQELIEIIEASKKLSLPDEASVYLLKDMGVEEYSVLTDSITELGEGIIGFDGVLGGTMHFTNIRILNDRWVFARFEDGHYGGYGIYRFEIIDDQIIWSTVAEYSDN